MTDHYTHYNRLTDPLLPDNAESPSTSSNALTIHDQVNALSIVRRITRYCVISIDDRFGQQWRITPRNSSYDLQSILNKRFKHRNLHIKVSYNTGSADYPYRVIQQSKHSPSTLKAIAFSVAQPDPLQSIHSILKNPSLKTFLRNSLLQWDAVTDIRVDIRGNSAKELILIHAYRILPVSRIEIFHLTDFKAQEFYDMFTAQAALLQIEPLMLIRLYAEHYLTNHSTELNPR